LKIVARDPDVFLPALLYSLREQVPKWWYVWNISTN